MGRKKSHCPKLDFRSLSLAAELHSRAGGDINKILPALDDILEEEKEKSEQALKEQNDK